MQAAGAEALATFQGRQFTPIQVPIKQPCHASWPLIHGASPILHARFIQLTAHASTRPSVQGPPVPLYACAKPTTDLAPASDCGLALASKHNGNARWPWPTRGRGTTPGVAAHRAQRVCSSSLTLGASAALPWSPCARGTRLLAAPASREPQTCGSLRSRI